ncbi:hypothetical protein DI005_07790 [Prauserella sp. PE36]|uniref:Uncharacterized protein n=1 Tax=Prauserella endophytica TaxID=1592324 RepID=A0ABY2S7N5_9PSEU|nr:MULTISPECIES: hypothetical protein [Prauserella]PXY26019.1 hypothetical protein BAY59_20955 [Prauserella coralliicola]RBM22015.1 hypothetical protein DI005_07790 [Prauserella sp. PE36]TKG71902.1 hypothetical protein FCN18_10475 [Prauserella endophytica]
MAQHIATFCGNCNCGCPELFVDHDAPEDKRVVITDDFGQRIQMSLDQWHDLVASAKAGTLDLQPAPA